MDASRQWPSAIADALDMLRLGHSGWASVLGAVLGHLGRAALRLIRATGGTQDAC